MCGRVSSVHRVVPTDVVSVAMIFPIRKCRARGATPTTLAGRLPVCALALTLGCERAPGTRFEQS